MRLIFTLCLIAMITFAASEVFATVPSSYDDGWLDIIKLAPNLYRFTECGAYSYLLIGQKEAVLIDAGYGVTNLRELSAKITLLPISVINTHGHVDHVGSDQFFDRVYIHEKDAGMIEQGLNPLLRDWAIQEIAGNHPPSHYDPTQYNYPPIKPYRLLNGGELLEFGDIKLEVIHTPGHTPGGITLFEPNRKLLFVGDTMVYGEMWIFLPESDVNQWIESAEKISKLAPKVNMVLSGHSKLLNAYDLEDLADVAAAVREAKESKAVPNEQGICRAGAYGFNVLFRKSM